MSAALLSIEGVSVDLPTPRGPLKAVDKVDLSLAPGRTLGVVGESGCGKTMLSRAVLQLLPKRAKLSGRVMFAGHDLVTLEPEALRRLRGPELAVVFQDPMTSLNPVRRISDQLVEAMVIHGRHDRPSALRRAIDLLGRMGITAPERAIAGYPHQFSGGMRQRAMIAMALACKPKLLIADEPTTALDVTIQAQILDLLRALVAEENAALILITHDLGVVAGMCERVNVMYAGMFMETGSAEQLFGTPRHPYTFGLLQSVPRLDAARRSLLQPIEGSPPNMLQAPSACPFQPRCRFEIDLSRREVPQLVEIEPGHQVACFNPVPVDEWDRVRTAATA